MTDVSERRALAAKYRQHAEEAEKWAKKGTTQKIREDYLQLAMGWLQLAESIEKSN